MVFNPTLSSMPKTLLSSRTGATFVELMVSEVEGEEEEEAEVGAEVVVAQLVLKDQMIKKMLKSASPTMGSGQVLGVHTSSTTTESAHMSITATFAMRSPM